MSELTQTIEDAKRSLREKVAAIKEFEKTYHIPTEQITGLIPEPAIARRLYEGTREVMADPHKFDKDFSDMSFLHLTHHCMRDYFVARDFGCTPIEARLYMIGAYK